MKRFDARAFASVCTDKGIPSSRPPASSFGACKTISCGNATGEASDGNKYYCDRALVWVGALAVSKSYTPRGAPLSDSKKRNKKRYKNSKLVKNRTTLRDLLTNPEIQIPRAPKQSRPPIEVRAAAGAHRPSLCEQKLTAALVTRHMSHVTISHVTSPHVPCCSVPFRPQDFPLLRVLLIDLTTSITVAPARRCHSRGQRKSASQRHAHPCLHAMEHQNLAEAIQLMEKIMAKLLLR